MESPAARRSRRISRSLPTLCPLRVAVSQSWKLRVLLAQALFADPDILLLDEPTNNLDIHTIRWLETVLNNRNSTMIIISHDRHFLNAVCTHMADIDYGELRIYPGNYDDFMIASTAARERMQSQNEKKQAQILELFGKLIMSEPNVLILDEPTNHLGMEAIEPLNLALEHYEGTLIFVSHDREFVSSLATRVIEISDKHLIDYPGTYDEYLAYSDVESKAVGT